MTKSYFPRIAALVSFIVSSVSVLSKATGYFNSGLCFSNPYSAEYRSWMLPNSYLNQKKYYGTYKKFSNQLFLSKKYQWLSMPSRTKKEEDKTNHTVHYQSEDSIIFDAKKNILSLHGASSLAYDNMKLEANVVALHLSANTISAKGTKELYGTSIGSPIFTYKDVTKNKYGKNDSTQTRTFFMEKIRYNIETKRALVYTLLTKQEESIVKSKQVKKEDEATFYAEDIIYTTCGLAHPHFYIRSKRAKMIQDKQITTGPFRFYFDDVPTPLGCVFGTLFLEGKRVHGIIPPEIGESDNGFYLRNGGYYINFNDYADISILGSIYSTGTRELKNKLHYKKRYLCSGNVYYSKNIKEKEKEKEKGWSLKWTHKTLSNRTRSFNANVNLHNESYKTLDDEDEKIPTNKKKESSASVSYEDQLIGLPYTLTVRAKFYHNLVSDFKSWTLPEGTLSSSAWHPFRIFRSKGAKRWFDNMQLKHTMDFQNCIQNAKKNPNPLYNKTPEPVPLTSRWNDHRRHGIKHTINLNMGYIKVFEFINLTPTFNYNEGWYWLKKGTKGPIRVPGFNRVYTWDFGAGLGTTLYHTQHFEEGTWVEGLRIKTEPSIEFKYTPDFSKKYFREKENEKGEKENENAFKNEEPSIHISNGATSTLTCKLQNKVELKVKKETGPEEKGKKQTSGKIFLLKNLDFTTQYDFKKEKFRLTDIDMHIASDAKVGGIGKIGCDLKTEFDPYLSEIVPSDSDETKMKVQKIHAFAWNHGQYLGQLKKAIFKVNIDFTHDSNKEKKKKKELLNDPDHLTNKIEATKIDFDEPWHFAWEFNCRYEKLNEYNIGQNDYKTEKYVNFKGNISLVKKWKVSLRSSYNFTKSIFEPSDTEISIQRDLHCWQLSYQWHPLENPAKYDFSLGVKANVLKALKLPRERKYNKLS